MNFHESVLLKQAVEELNVRKGKKYIDATLGGGGHSEKILEKGGVVLGLDLDLEAIKFAETRLKGKDFRTLQGNFKDLKELALRVGFGRVRGILFDLGTSNFQLEEASRGFSFQREAPLDMRMDSTLSVTAADLVNGLNAGELYELFTKYGEESYSRPIARAIVTSRLKKKIETTKELADLISSVVRRREKIHPATKVFQALRIAVNDEINNLKEALPQAVEILEKEGRLVVVSFHSLEDRVVKQFFKEQEGISLKVLTDKPLTPDWEEVRSNPRSRSAKMRVAEKI